jgi:hypothetical protein
MLGDGTISDGSFIWRQSTIHTPYLKYVLNIFANSVGSTFVDIKQSLQSVQGDDLFYHGFEFQLKQLSNRLSASRIGSRS